MIWQIRRISDDKLIYEYEGDKQEFGGEWADSSLYKHINITLPEHVDYYSDYSIRHATIELRLMDTKSIMKRIFYAFKNISDEKLNEMMNLFDTNGTSLIKLLDNNDLENAKLRVDYLYSMGKITLSDRDIIKNEMTEE